MGFIILLIRVITHADFNVISPGKSVAAAIAATGTSQSPLGGSQPLSVAARSSAGRSMVTQRSSSTSDIVTASPVKPHRQRTLSTGSGGRYNNNNSVSATSTTPIVINNHHHLHLHYNCGTSENSAAIPSVIAKPNHLLKGNQGTVTKPSPTVPGLTLVNEVEPLLSRPSATKLPVSPLTKLNHCSEAT